jgi:hypothetical protein
MSHFITPLDMPARYQWDVDSKLPLPEPGTAPGNCGVTCVTATAQYYQDVRYGIYSTRRLVVSDDSQLFTSVGDQAWMLSKRGVPNHILRPTIRELTNILANERRPVTVGMDMSRVPLAIAGHPFRGSHGILLRANGVKNGVPGKWAMDPNFNRTFRRDPTEGRRFYPDSILQVAYFDSGKWAIVPEKDKVVQRYVNVNGPEVNIRHAPPVAFRRGNVFARSRKDGIYRLDTGNKLSGLGYDFEFKYWRETDRGTFAIVKGYGRRLAIRQGNCHFV